MHSTVLCVPTGALRPRRQSPQRRQCLSEASNQSLHDRDPRPYYPSRSFRYRSHCARWYRRQQYCQGFFRHQARPAAGRDRRRTWPTPSALGLCARVRARRHSPSESPCRTEKRYRPSRPYRTAATKVFRELLKEPPDRSMSQRNARAQTNAPILQSLDPNRYSRPPVVCLSRRTCSRSTAVLWRRTRPERSSASLLSVPKQHRAPDLLDPRPATMIIDETRTDANVAQW